MIGLKLTVLNVCRMLTVAAKRRYAGQIPSVSNPTLKWTARIRVARSSAAELIASAQMPIFDRDFELRIVDPVTVYRESRNW